MQWDKNQYKTYTWSHFMSIIWMLNPTMAFNEIVLGQRIAKVSLRKLDTDQPRIASYFVPCPHCHAIHDARIWSINGNTMYKNWFGLYCKDCGNIIPCLINFTTFILLTISYPLWGWYKKKLYQKWLNAQAPRYTNLTLTTDTTYDNKNWISSGIVFAGLLFVFNTLVLYSNDTFALTTFHLLISIVLHLVLGIIFGFSMHLFYHRKSKK